MSFNFGATGGRTQKSLSAHEYVGRRGKSSIIIGSISSTGRDEARPISSLKGSKTRDQSSPHHFAEDTKTIRIFNDHEASELDNTSTPPDYKIPRKGKVQQNKSQPDNECLMIARENQKNGTHAASGSLGSMGRVLNESSQHPYHHNASRSKDHKPSALETTASWTQSQSSHSNLSLRKHNNNERTYGINGRQPAKIVPGAAIVKTPIPVDDDIEDSDDDNGVKDKRNGGIQWSGGERNDSSNKEKRYGDIHRSGDAKKYSSNKTHGHQSSKSRAPLVDKKQPSQTSYNRYGDRDKLVDDNLRSTNGVGKSRKPKRKRDSDDDEEYTFSDEDMKKGGTKKPPKSYGVSTRTFHPGSQNTVCRKSPRLGHRSSRNDEVIELMDSEDDSVQIVSACHNTQGSESSQRPQMGEKTKVDAVRIAIGGKVYRSKCRVSFQPGGTQQYLSFSYSHNKVQPPFVEDNAHKVLVDDISELKFCNGDEELDENLSSFDDAMIFITMRITPTSSNKLTGLHHYLSDEQYEGMMDLKNKRRFIVIEFRNNEDLNKLLQSMSKNPILTNLLKKDGSKLISSSDISNYSSALLGDNRAEKRKRSQSMSPSVKSNKVLLVYPFDGREDVIEEAARGLNEASIQIRNYSEIPLQRAANTDTESGESQEKTVRAHYLTIRDEDRLRLINEEFLNDTLVDFWMQWIARFQRKRSSLVHFFSSHFYTTLDKEGPSGVSSWTSKKEINIFEKKFIFIPINESLHWSLCVVVNAGNIRYNWSDENPPEKNDEVPCLLFLDSLKAHKKFKVANNVRRWLNFENKRLEYATNISEEPFNQETMALYDPKVPYQDNSWDCGVYVCRYALGLMQTVLQPFTQDDAAERFRSLITHSDNFKFSGVDISRIRGEMNSLILGLSEIFQYLKAKESENTQESEEPTNTQLELNVNAVVPEDSEKPKAEGESDKIRIKLESEAD